MMLDHFRGGTPPYPLDAPACRHQCPLTPPPTHARPPRAPLLRPGRHRRRAARVESSRGRAPGVRGCRRSLSTAATSTARPLARTTTGRRRSSRPSADGSWRRSTLRRPRAPCHSALGRPCVSSVVSPTPPRPRSLLSRRARRLALLPHVPRDPSGLLPRGLGSPPPRRTSGINVKTLQIRSHLQPNY